MNCTLKVKLTEDECQKVDAACVRETARRGSVQNRSDLLRAWIAAGCPVQAEQRAGPQTAPAWGWRKIAPGETIEQGDEFLVREGNAGRWIEARNRIGTKVAFKEDFRRPLHAPPASLVRPADSRGSIGFEVWDETVKEWEIWRTLEDAEVILDGDEWFHAESGLWIPATVTIGHSYTPGVHARHRRRREVPVQKPADAERAEWPDDIGSGGAAPSEAVSEKAACVEPPAASVQGDANAGGAGDGVKS